MKSLWMVLFLVACGGAAAKPATVSNDKPVANDAAAPDCPATLNCQPPTNDENPVCSLPAPERQKRCPNTRFLD